MKNQKWFVLFLLGVVSFTACKKDKTDQQANDLIAAKSEILRLRAQLHRTEEERDILKKAAAYFAQDAR